MKKQLISLFAAALLLASCSDADSSTESAVSGEVTLDSSLAEFYENADESAITDRITKLGSIQSQMTVNAQAELIYNTFNLACANMVVDGKESKIPVGELPQTVVSKLGDDELQSAVKEILNFNGIDDGKVSWVISGETRRPVSVSFVPRDGRYTGTAPDPTPYSLPDKEVEALKAELTEPDYVSYADYLRGAEQSDEKRELTREEDLTIDNAEAKALYEYLGSMMESYVNTGEIAALKEDNKISASPNMKPANPVYRELLDKAVEDAAKLVDELDPTGEKIYRPDSPVIFVKFDKENNKLLFVQFSIWDGRLVGQYPDPIYDVDYPFVMGEKMDPDLEYDPNTAVQRGIFDN